MTHTTDQGRSPGRPTLYADGLRTISVTVTPEQHEWLRQQDAGISPTIRQLIDEAMKETER